MARRFYQTAEDEKETRIRRLEEQLYLARQTIVELAPDAVQGQLKNFWHCKSWAEFHEWERTTVEIVIALAVPIPNASHFEERAYCPLCREGSSGPYDVGFKIPGGMQMHLRGEGNARRCEVFDAARELALTHCRPAMEEHRKQLQQAEANRKRSEPLIMVWPDREPVLSDEGLWSREKRTTESFRAAEKRLESIGFTKEQSENVATFIYRKDNLEILADPRAEGRINFCVYDPRKRNQRTTVFYLLDKWSDPTAKFLKRLQEAAKTLATDGFPRRR